jgi:hypothetical protein
MKIAIHQPHFMPWLGYFDKMDKVDIFVLLDNVQFKKNEFQNRSKIKTSNNWQWLTVPVSFRFGDRIMDVGINSTVNWKNKHLQAIRTNYGKAPYFKDYFPRIEELYKMSCNNLSVLNYETILLIKEVFSIKTEIVIASNIPNIPDEPTERLIAICRYFDAHTYLAGAGGKNYMALEKFRESGLNLEFQHFNHPEYRQLFGSFEPFMSAIDYIFNCGPSFDPIREINREVEAYR